MIKIFDLKKLQSATQHILQDVIMSRLIVKARPNSRTYDSISSIILKSGTAPENNEKLSQALPGLKDARKIRLNMLKLTRVGMKPARKESLRDFVVINTETDEKLIFIKLHHSNKVDTFKIELFKYNTTIQGENPEGTALMRSQLVRNHNLRTVACEIYSSDGRPVAYVYDLEGVIRTAIIENGDQNKCLYQLQTKTSTGWTQDARIYCDRGRARLGHFTKLEGFQRDELMIYLRIHSDLDVQSKCFFIASALYLVRTQP